jgi:carboxyl-terminal processing protease
LNEIDSEKFIDRNGNGKWDKPETYRDINNNDKRDSGEKFVDINRNGQWDSAEDFIDSNDNGKWDREGILKGLIIDLRGNSGGLLREATSILNSLIRKGENLLYTKGRGGRVLRKYKSTSDPVLSESVPIIILVNKSSASASEIIAGVIQDLDRGVILGNTTFGKGLVQQIKTLNDTISLKVTNAKYYIPSGRLIQKEDWLKDGYLTDGLNLKDSVFYTANMGRVVYGGGGIKPDLKTNIDKAPAFINMLWKKGLFLSFSAQYVAKHNIDKNNFTISSQIIKDFENFCNNVDDDLDYLLPGEKELRLMKRALGADSGNDKQGMLSIFRDSDASSRYIANMEKYFRKQKNKQFKSIDNQKWLINGLEKEFTRILLGERDRIGVSLKIDSEYDEAIKILKNIYMYDSILGVDNNEGEKDY